VEEYRRPVATALVVAKWPYVVPVFAALYSGHLAKDLRNWPFQEQPVQLVQALVVSDQVSDCLLPRPHFLVPQVKGQRRPQMARL